MIAREKAMKRDHSGRPNQGCVCLRGKGSGGAGERQKQRQELAGVLWRLKGPALGGEISSLFYFFPLFFFFFFFMFNSISLLHYNVLSSFPSYSCSGANNTKKTLRQ
ncbi:hypothetical protein LY76DRAFT_73691 [Colletotrichum caudatum]|nr:hypothetical protein LY76DRAFT_73691 [Colletotrichum caudatum]